MALCECDRFTGRLADICNGTADLPIETINKYRAIWKLGQLPDDGRSVVPLRLAGRGSESVEVAADSPVRRGAVRSRRSGKPAGCGCKANRASKPALPPNECRPGFQLLAYWKNLRAPPCQACIDLAAQMDLWGITRCREKMDFIVEDILPRAKVWVASKVPWWIHAFVPGVAEDAALRVKIRHDVTAAINAAEANWTALQAARTSKALARKAAGPVIEPVTLQPLVNPTRNLIFHLFPKLGAEFNWHWHIDQIRRAAPLFNGKIAIGIVHGPGTATPDVVKQLMSDIPVTDWVIHENTKALSETATFMELMSLVQTDDPNSITLRGHSKGVTHPAGTLWQEWAELMWATCLDLPSVEAALNTHVMAGSMKCHKGLIDKKKYPWFYAGSVYWFRSAVFQRNWHSTESTRWFAEAWPGTVCRNDEAYCLCHDNTEGPALRDPYWQSKVVPDFKRWKASRPGYVADPRMPTQPIVITQTQYSPGVTLISPTGDRPEAFALCERWISRQTYQGPLQWIVIDDGIVATKCTMDQTYVRRQPRKGHTLAANLRAALSLVKHDKVLIIEDDEWYARIYVQQMSDWLDRDELVGGGYARYYWPRQARYREFHDHKHASLCRTGIKATLLPTLAACCKTEDPSIDMRLWKAAKGVRHDLSQPLVVGMKGMPGRKSGGGDPKAGLDDGNLKTLRSWIGDDVELYRPMLPKVVERSHEKIVVFTVVVGGYDSIRVPEVINPNVRYVAITDGAAPAPWEVMRPPASDLSLKHASRKWKLLGPTLFPDAEWTIYYDGQLQMMRDPLELLAECKAWGDADFYAFRHHDRDCIFDEFGAIERVRRDSRANMAKQRERYRQMEFPAHAGLYLGGMLIRRGGGTCDAFNEAWWHEVSTGSHRDQISMPIAIAGSGVRFQPLPALWWQHFFVRHPHRHDRAKGRMPVLRARRRKV